MVRVKIKVVKNPFTIVFIAVKFYIIIIVFYV